MNGLRLFEPVINPLEVMLPRLTNPWRLDKELMGMKIRVDVVEKDGVYKVRADLPGVKKEDINVRIDGNIVQIDAQTQDAKEFKENGGRVLRSEHRTGSQAGAGKGRWFLRYLARQGPFMERTSGRAGRGLVGSWCVDRCE